MPRFGRLFTAAVLTALLLPWTSAVLCAREGGKGMPCCKTETPCDLRIQGSGCCALERTPETPTTPPGVQTQAPGPSPVRQIPIASIDEALFDAALALRVHGGDRLWYPPAHDRSPSLFLRNLAILR